MSAGFFTLHAGLLREGPGDRDSLDWALGMAGTGRAARILDAGAGAGADVVALLAHAPEGHVTAIDLHPPFVARIAESHAGDPRVTALVADMAAPPAGPFDLIWSAGAIYFLGVAEALGLWRNALAPGGRVAFSQIAWRVAVPSPECAAYWAGEYPAMSDAGGVLAQVEAAGYRVLGQRWLGPAAWRAYYDPLAARAASLAAAAPDADLAAALAEHAREQAIWHAYGAEYDYLLVVAEPVT